MFTVKVPVVVLLSPGFELFVACRVKVVVPAGVAVVVVIVSVDVFELWVDVSLTQLGMAGVTSVQEVENKLLAPAGNPVTLRRASNAPAAPEPLARFTVTAKVTLPPVP